MRLKLTYVLIGLAVTKMVGHPPAIAQVSPLVASSSSPDWVRAKPVSESYYYGIGNASLTHEDYQATAKEEALADMVSEISVKISSNSVLFQFEKDREFVETYRNDIEATTTKVIEGHQLVDSWTGEKHFWTMYRLSKADYALLLQRKKSIALSNGLSELKLAQSQMKASPASAFSSYCRCLEVIAAYLGEETKVAGDAEVIDLGSNCYAGLQHLSAHLHMAVAPTVKRPRRGKSDVLFRAKVTVDEVSFKNLSVELFDGDTNQSKAVQSDGSLSLSTAEVSAKSQKITLRPDFAALHHSPSPVINRLIENLSKPTVEIRLLPARVVLYVESEEYNLGVATHTSLTAVHLKSELTALGYDLVDLPEKSDITISIIAQTRKGHEVSGLFTSYLDMEVTARDTSTKMQIYSHSIESIKGINLNYKKAGKQAYSNSNNKIKEEIAQDIINHF